MTTEEREHLLNLIVSLGRARENAIVSAALVVYGLHWLLTPSQGRLEVARHLYVRECRPAVIGMICGAMQH